MPGVWCELDGARVSASLGCARCGDCCENIPMAALDRMVQLRAEGRNADNSRWCADVDFMSAHWTALPDDPNHYSYDRFDPVERLCTDQEGKPPVCRDFPFYGSSDLTAYAPGLELRCSYLLDIKPEDRPEGARPLIPIEVIRG